MNKLSRLTVLLTLLTAGCVTYTIDSNPQGLRVTIDEIERGVTPCQYTVAPGSFLDIEVVPPTCLQRQQYEAQKGVKITDYYPLSQSKHVYTSDGSGTIFFEFITDERPVDANAPSVPAIESKEEAEDEWTEEEFNRALSHTLNFYNTYYDNFSGVITVNDIYLNLNNAEMDPRLRFRVIQVLSEKAILVHRDSARGFAEDYFGNICEEVTFLIYPKHPYADGAKLREGSYRCKGTQTYETKGGNTKTVYAFEEVTPTEAEETP